MYLVNLIDKYDNDNKVKEAISNMLLKNIENKNIPIKQILSEIASHITDDIECMVDEDYGTHCGYGDNVRSDIKDKILKLLVEYFG
jgi:hypothetical protein